MTDKDFSAFWLKDEPEGRKTQELHFQQPKPEVINHLIHQLLKKGEEFTVDTEAETVDSLQFLKKLTETLCKQEGPSTFILSTDTALEWRGEKLQGRLIWLLEDPQNVLSVKLSSNPASIEIVNGYNLEKIKTIIFAPDNRKKWVGAIERKLLKKSLHAELGVKPLPTEKLTLAYATRIIKEVGKSISEEEKLTNFKREANELIHNSTSTQMSAIEELCENSLNAATYEKVKRKVQNELILEPASNAIIDSQKIRNKLKSYIKSVTLDKDLSVVVNGKKEILALERVVDHNENGVYLIRVTVKN